MTQFKTPSIRKSLIILITVMTAVPVAIIAFSAFVERGRQIQDAKDDATRYAGQIGMYFTQFTRSSELILTMLSRLEIVQKQDEKAVNGMLLNMVIQYPEFSSIFLVDKAGLRWASTNPIKGIASYSDRRYFINAVSSGGFSSGEYTVGKVKSRPIFSFALPFKDSGGVITGAGVASIELESLKSLSKLNNSEDGLTIVILDHKGTTLLHSSRPELNGSQEQEAVFRKIKEGAGEGSLETEGDSRGGSKILSYRKLQLPGESSPYMYVRVEISRDLIMKGPNKRLAVNMALLLVVTAVSLVVVLKISQRYLLNKVEEIERTVAERTRELQEKNDNIMESIDYAERLQRSILPPLAHRLGIPDDKCFVIWKPRDIVGGDMYWCRGDDRYVLVAVADCTGHGVPGALMTMALSSILDGLPRSLEGVKPSALLNSIHSSLKETLRQEHKDSLANDGADVALCLLDKEAKKFLFAGAKLSLFMEKNGQITEYKGVRHSVGYSLRKDVIFEDREIEWIDGSAVYLTTDGLLDQNREDGKGGIGRTGFVRLLQNIAGKSFAERETAVVQIIAERLQHVEQRDDITVIGFELG
ncbi:MAG TPA: SpoIIE family protein phosphatase [Desulfuromonadales bacterium]|nr:SpoIIE family protein phosphatase [Desulfuromonadales bacterium]